jgi:hypothetical protein
MHNSTGDSAIRKEGIPLLSLSRGETPLISLS